MTIFRSKMPEYVIWEKMISRCSSPNATDYARYGGRGISVCDRWRDFDQFLSDVGPRPTPSHSLDRKDNDGNYEPGNVTWATKIEQQNNKRNTHWVEYRGQRMSIADAVRAAGSLVTRENAACRIKTGWSVAKAVETPPLFRRDPVTRRVSEGRHQRMEKR